MKVGLFMGQSNANGAGHGGPWDIDSRVKAWNSTNNREDTTLLGTSWVTPNREAAPFFLNSNFVSNNQAAHVGHFLARALNENQRIVHVARSGKPIDLWHTGSAVGAVYTRMKAVLAAAGVAKVDWFGWNHGSANNLTANTYRAKWDALIARMTSDGVIDASTPIFITETSWVMTPLINPVLEQIAADSPRIGYVRAGHYDTHDGTHFTGPSLYKAGYEAVRAMAGTETWLKNVINPLAECDVIGTGYSRKS